MFGSQLSAQPNPRQEPLDLERHGLPAPDRTLQSGNGGAIFKRLKTKGLEGSFLLNHQEFLISQGFENQFSTDWSAGNDLAGLRLFKAKFVDSEAFDL
jgi:hypothetical protein